MKLIAIALLSFMFFASTAHSDIVALGVGAVSPSEVVVKIDGKNVNLGIEGTKPSGDPAAESFLRCLVAGRVVRVHKTSARIAKVTMLDGTSVADLVNEFLGTRTKIDACALGKAAYQPQYAHVSGDAASQPAAGTPAKKTHEVHISYGSTTSKEPPPLLMPRDVAYPERPRPATPRVQPSEVQTLAAPGAISSYQPGQARMASPSTASTTTVGTGSTTSPSATQPETPQPIAPYTPPVTVQKPPER